jgi:hypothetical protein
MSKTKSSFRSRTLRAGIATAGATAVAIAATTTPAFAAATALTLSATTGPASATTNTITITASASTAWLLGVSAPVTTYSLPACPTTYTSTASTAVTPSSSSVGNVLQANATDTTKISNYKATMSLPTLPLSSVSATTTKYNVCVYASSTASDPLIGTATYSVAGAAALASSGTVTPSSGPALGGSTITIAGTGFPTTSSSISATLGGTPLTNITAVSSTSFTATTPYHASGAVALAVTTPAGTVTKQSAYTYSNGIVISPNTGNSVTATSSAPLYVDVNGSNFLAMTFPTYTSSVLPVIGSGALDKAQVFLMSGAYKAGATGMSPATTYTNGPTGRCGSVVVISDSELICSIDLKTGALTAGTGVAASSAVPDGTYTLTVVSNGASGTAATNDPLAASATVPVGITVSDISSGATFTVAPY